MLRTILLIVLMFASGGAFAQGVQPDHAPYTRLLQSYVSEPGREDGLTRVDYDAWRDNAADRAALDAYIEHLEGVAVSALPQDEAFAYWANLYNAVTVKLILDENPSRSIRQIRPTLLSIGPWGVERVTVEGQPLSLDNIEHDIMRVEFPEPALVHYAVNCASIGCPNLQREAWTAEGLDARLREAARAYVNSPRGVRVTDRGLVVSSIYQWFKVDFGGDDEGVIAHLLQYAEPDLAAQIRDNPRIRGNEYDWDLNRPE